MRILVNDYAGYALCVELSRSLADKGHKVLHTYAGFNTTPKGELDIEQNEIQNLEIHAIYTKQHLQKYSFLKRWKQEREYGDLLINEIQSYQPDVVLSADTPLDAQKSIINYCSANGIKFVFWLQDVIGLATERLLRKKIPIIGSIIGKYYISMEKTLLQRSNKIVLITDDFAPLMQQWGIAKGKTITIPNWGPLNNINTGEKVNDWSQKFNLANTFNFMYTGTIGMKHNPDLLLQLAIHFNNNPMVRIVVVSEGPGASWLLANKEKMSLENMLVMNYQHYNVLSKVLASSDVLMAILEPEASVFSVPSKILSYLCAQRALLLAIPAENMAARIVNEFQAGLVVDPNRVDNFITSAIELYENQEKRDFYASNARAYAEDNFDINNISKKFEQSIIW